ncbi:MAG: MFS transporter [Anaerolineales bacterium]|nr:MFS transporter [Chloroflexota bacterium]MBL6981494.1 MFS transporter [Anaerolineales bacterium]
MKLHIPPSLLHRRFRLLWSGLLVSAAGGQMQFWALLWHIRILTDQPIALGAIGAARIVPIVIFSLFGGLTADTFDRRRVLFVTQTVRMGVALILSWLTFTGQIVLWHIYTLTVMDAIAHSFGLPSRQSLTPNLVPAQDLPNAFSMQSMAFTAGSIVGPALSGLVIGYLGQTWVYSINAFSYVALFLALFAMGPIEQQIALQRSGSKGNWLAIREGIDFILNHPIILASMILDFFATFFSSANALLPIFAKDILGVSEIGYGWLSAAQSVGAALTSVIISQISVIRRQGVILLMAVVSYGIWTLVFGVSRSYAISFFALAMMGASDTVSMIIRNTIRQLQTPDYIRGRMTSINQIFFMGGPQLGEVEAGLVAQFLGAPFAVISGGLGCVLAVGWIAKRWPQLRTYQGNENF